MGKERQEGNGRAAGVAPTRCLRGRAGLGDAVRSRGHGFDKGVRFPHHEAYQRERDGVAVVFYTMGRDVRA
jgi:hypothetical protein